MDFAWEEASLVFMSTLAGLLIVLFILILALWFRVRKMKKRYMHMMNSPNLGNLEQAIIELQERISELEQKSGVNEKRISNAWEKMKRQKANVGFVRFNAFEQQGSPLSFSIALIDEQKTGFVLTGIHGREQTYMFAKSLDEGVSDLTLSSEEKEAISNAYSSFKTGIE